MIENFSHLLYATRKLQPKINMYIVNENHFFKLEQIILNLQNLMNIIFFLVQYLIPTLYMYSIHLLLSSATLPKPCHLRGNISMDFSRWTSLSERKRLGILAKRHSRGLITISADIYPRLDAKRGCKKRLRSGMQQQHACLRP